MCDFILGLLIKDGAVNFKSKVSWVNWNYAETGSWALEEKCERVISL